MLRDVEGNKSPLLNEHFAEWLDSENEEEKKDPQNFDPDHLLRGNVYWVLS